MIDSGTKRHLRRLVHLRETAPADHHRYLLHLIIQFMAKPGDVADFIAQYEEEFDVHTSAIAVHPG